MIERSTTATPLRMSAAPATPMTRLQHEQPPLEMHVDRAEREPELLSCASASCSSSRAVNWTKRLGGRSGRRMPRRGDRCRRDSQPAVVENSSSVLSHEERDSRDCEATRTSFACCALS